MSVKVMSLVWDHGPESSTDRFVLLALADYADDNGECWPAIATLARKCQISERTVIRAINRLRSDGYLVRSKRQSTSNYYTIVSDKMTPSVSDKMTPTIVTESHLRGDRESLKPSLETPLDPSYTKDETPDFISMRNLLSEMAGLLPTPGDIKAIEQCVELGITGDDVAGALQWRKDNRRQSAKTISQLLPGIITNHSIRVQGENARPTIPGKQKEEHWAEVHK